MSELIVDGVRAGDMTIGKLKFEPGDVMMIAYDPTNYNHRPEVIGRIVKNHPKAFPGVRLLLMPKDLDITRMRFDLDGKHLDPIGFSAHVLRLRERTDT